MQESPLQRIVPTADQLLQMTPQQLAPILLKLALPMRQGAGFVPHSVAEYMSNDGYPGHKRGQVDLVLTKAWNWIERKGFIEPSPAPNGANGWRIFTEEGEAVANGADLGAVKIAQEFPKAVLHPAVVAKCWKLFEEQNYPEAVEKSFKVVRDRLRDLTTHETGSDAFGKGKLHLKGAVAPNADYDFMVLA
ncbi:MAG TPA: TIGR02391 family protein [Rhizomicrobium sp.]|jgi:hypothetical protein|nr:TIGR02391 family protein [Rhizomicrobium sp.]